MKIGSVIKWEQMTDRSFLTMQYDNEDDVMKLLYCISSPNATFEDFKKEVLNDYKIAIQSRECSLLGRREVLTGKAKFGIFGDGKEP